MGKLCCLEIEIRQWQFRGLSEIINSKGERDGIEGCQARGGAIV